MIILIIIFFNLKNYFIFKIKFEAITNFCYLGCYGDGEKRDMPFNLIVYSDKLTIELCVETCRTNGYLYAGAQWRLRIKSNLSIKNNFSSLFISISKLKALNVFALIYMVRMV